MSRGKIPEEILDAIRERTAIEQIIGEYVPLKRAGRHFKGLCPFHHEKTPSFTVNTDLQIFKCFGCGESGNVFNFLMKYENISFFEAVERLAASAGISLPDTPVESKQKRDETSHILDAMQAAWKKYIRCLQSDPAAESARRYLSERGITEPLCKRYGLGFAPDQWDFLSTSLQIPRQILVKSGLSILGSESNKIYDRFRNRIMFPIRDYRKGHVIAFGGRTLGDDPAKYINSPESPIYHKSNVLYGLYEAHKEIRTAREVILVEGYFDRISLDRAGFPNAVAPCGTAITADQIRLLKRFADKVYLLFDSDEAGMKAARKALELCLSAGLETRAIPLPEGMDPDDVLRTLGPDGLKEHISRAVSGLDFLIRSASKRFDLSQARGRREAVDDMIPFLVNVENSIDRGAFISRIADLLSVPVESVLELCRRHRMRHIKENAVSTGEANNSNNSNTDPATDQLDVVERDLFCFLLQNPDYLSWDHNPLTAESMRSGMGKEIYRLLRDTFRDMGQLPVARILERTEDKRVQRILIDLFDDPNRNRRLVDRDSGTVFQSLVHAFRERDLRNELSFIKKQLSKCDISDVDADFLLRRQLEILEELNAKSSLDAG